MLSQYLQCLPSIKHKKPDIFLLVRGYSLTGFSHFSTKIYPCVDEKKYQHALFALIKNAQRAARWKFFT